MLVRVRATSVNIAEWYAVVGRPWIARPTMGLRRPRDIRLGVDYAGVVEEVGKDVTEFQPGDEVFGGRSGAWAEYVAVKAERAIVKKPADVSFEQAGAVGTAALTALQGLRDKGRLLPGQRVLINGASGGVGTYAVQIAKALGGVVTAVCSTPNVEIARSLGADVVVDYTVEDVTTRRRALRPRARHRRHAIVVGASARARAARERSSSSAGRERTACSGRSVTSPGRKLRALRGSQRATFFLATFNKADMETLRDFLEDGKLTSVIDSTYPLDEIGAALEHMGEGHPRGKIVVTV